MYLQAMARRLTPAFAPFVLLHRNVLGLHFAARPRVVGNLLGQLLAPLAGLSCVPLAVSLFAGQHAIAIRYVLVVMALGGCAFVLTRRRCPADVQTNEAMAVTALVFIVASLVMTVPMMGYGIDFLDAWFEAVSGVTTTGLSTLDGVAGRPDAFLFSRAWLQWVGGLGVVVLALAMLIRSGAASRKLGFDDREMENVAGGTRSHARHLLVVYLVLTVLACAALLACGEPFLDALAHAMAAISTGGFSNHDDSLAGVTSIPARTIIIVTCFAGAMPFVWYYRGFYGRLKTLASDPGIRALVLLTGSASCLLYYTNDWSGLLTHEAVGHAVLMTVSAQTTAGFSSIDVASLDPAAKLVMSGSMFIGGEIGSTAGGIKILRLLVLARLLHLLILQTSTPANAHLPLKLDRHTLELREVGTIVSIFVAYLFVLITSWFVFVAHGAAPIDALFEVASALGTAGISSGLTGPDLAPALKLLLIVNMLLGRVETIALIVLLLPGTWIGRRRSSS